MRLLLACLVIAAVGIEACGGGVAPASAQTAAPAASVPPASAAAPSAPAGGLSDAAFAWCVDGQNEPKLNKAAQAVGTDLDQLQATLSATYSGSADAYNAALRADAGYIKACAQAYAQK